MPILPKGPKRRTVRGSAKPIRNQATGLKGHVQRFFLSFTPANFRSYWLSRAGLVRIGKLAGVGVLFVVLVFLWYAKDLPSPSKINAKLGLTTTFYARDAIDSQGNVDFAKATKLYEVHGDQNRILANLDQIPDTIKQATIAIEDKNFYKEGAFSASGLARAFTGVLTGDRSKGGGSTITQQYVKNALLTNEHSFTRKIKELILAIEISQFYSKDDILKLYLNEIPYSNGAYGIEAACRTYFSEQYGKVNCAKNLNLSQAALLAAIPNLPGYYNPYGDHQDALLDRQHTILDKMAEQGYATKAQAEAAKWTAANLDTTAGNKALSINKVPTFYSSITAPNFVNEVQIQLQNKYGAAAVEEGGWKVVTSLDANLQKCAELAVYNPGNETCSGDGKTTTNPNKSNGNYNNLRKLGGSNAAVVAADPRNGQVLAMVGSYNYAISQYNVATHGRQPGSSFKPYAYAALFSKNNSSGCTSNTTKCDTYGAGSILSDTIETGNSFGTYKPRDFGGSAEVGGPVTVRTALGGSLNIPAVQALQLAGTSNTLKLVKSMGITTTLPDNDLSIVLGSGDVKLLDHVNAYESFANGGVHYDPTMVLKIYDSKSNVLEDNTKPKTPKKVLDPQVAYLIANMMSDKDARSYIFGSQLDIPGHVGRSQQGQGVAVKTGTTNDVRDAWTMGYTPSIVAGVWAGNNDNAPMTSQAVNIAGPIWQGFMTAALAGKSIETFTKPDGLQYLSLPGNALKASSSSDYFPKWYKAPFRKTVKIDTVSGKLATSCTPPLAVKETLDTGITDSDDVHSCDDTAPTVNLDNLSGSGPYTVKAKVTLGTFGTSKPGTGSAKLEIYFNDTMVSTQSVSSSGTYTANYSPDSGGTYTVKAVITDTGLYTGSDQTTVVANSGGASSGNFSGTSPAAGSSYPSGAVNFSWNASDSGGPYQLFVDGSQRTTTNNTSVTFPVLTKTTHSWYVRDSAGNKTDPITFTVS